jgi:dienelactone hydrolase
MHGPRLVCLLAALGALVAWSAQATRTEHVEIPPQPVAGSRMPTTTLGGLLTEPDGPGPFPAIIVLHGCGGGPGPAQKLWAQRLNGWGYATLAPSSFPARGIIGGVCEPYRQKLATAQDRAGDVISAALWLRSRPEIDGAHIGVIGFSHGGSTAAWVTQRQYEEAYPNLLKAAVDFYGPCRQPHTKGAVPLLALAGEADTWGYSARACRSFGAQLQPEQVFELHTYAGATHDFDYPGQAQGSMLGHPRGYDQAAAEDSYARVKVFLARYVLSRRN